MEKGVCRTKESSNTVPSPILLLLTPICICFALAIILTLLKIILEKHFEFHSTKKLRLCYAVPL